MIQVVFEHEQLTSGQAIHMGVLVRQVGQLLNLPEAGVTATLCYLL